MAATKILCTEHPNVPATHYCASCPKAFCELCVKLNIVSNTSKEVSKGVGNPSGVGGAADLFAAAFKAFFGGPPCKCGAELKEVPRE